MIYWRNMYLDIKDFCQTCDTCLQAKRDYSHKTRPLNPLQVAEGPFHTWAIDHKDLCRKTTGGSVAILCCVDSFSGWPILAPVPSLDAETTARVFFKEVVSRFGIPRQVSSDRGSAFMSTFFTTLMKLLNIKHRISAAKAPRSNGLAEALVKRLSDLIKIYVKNDSEIEHYLPLIEMSLRATAHTQHKLSPFQIIHGFRMNVGEPLELTDTPKLTKDQQSYYNWLSHRLKGIHDAVMLNQKDNKEQMKAVYDKRHNVSSPTFKVGDKVLLQDKRVKFNSDQVLTKRPFQGPYFIADIVQGQADIGQAYKLINEKTGKTLPSLISGDRLKEYRVEDRSELDKRLPGAKPREAVLSPSPVDKSNDWEAALRILRERTVNKKKEWLVLFNDKSQWWCDDVTPALIREFRVRQAKRRKRR